MPVQCAHSWSNIADEDAVKTTAPRGLSNIAAAAKCLKEIPRLQCDRCGVVVGAETYSRIKPQHREEWLAGFPRLGADGYRDPYGTATAFLYKDEFGKMHQVEVDDATDVQLVAFVKIWRKRFIDYDTALGLQSISALDTLIRQHVVTGESVYAEIGKRGLLHHVAVGSMPKQGGKLSPVPDIYSIALEQRKQAEAEAAQQKVKPWSGIGSVFNVNPQNPLTSGSPPSGHFKDALGSMAKTKSQIEALTQIAQQQTNSIPDTQITKPKPAKKKKADDGRKILDFAEPGVRKIKLD